MSRKKIIDLTLDNISVDTEMKVEKSKNKKSKKKDVNMDCDYIRGRGKREIIKTESYSEKYCVRKPKKNRKKRKKIKELTKEEINFNSIGKLEKTFSNTLNPVINKIEGENKNKVIDRTTNKIRNSEKCKVYVTGNTTYMVTSSKGDKSYEVTTNIINNNKVYSCNCNKLHGSDEKSICKHIYAILLHDFRYVLEKDLSKPFDIKKSENMKMFHFTNKFQKTL